MDFINAYCSAHNINLTLLLSGSVILLLVLLVLGTAGKVLFGKRSTLSCVVSSAISILFLYAITIVVSSLSLPVEKFFAPLPMVTIYQDELVFFSFFRADFLTICSELVSLLLLCTIASLIDTAVRQGKNFFTWFLLRCLTVILALLAHLLVSHLMLRFLPEGITTYAPVILLGVLVLMLLTGMLKFVLGAFLTTIHPMIAALYTFFFAHRIGKQIWKSVLTTTLLSGVIIVLNKVGIAAVSVAAAVLPVYIPLLLALAGLWYLSYKTF